MIYVVTATHNRKNITEKFIESLLSQKNVDITPLIVDDGSTDGTVEMIKNLSPNSVIIHGNGNLWWGGALQKAYIWIKNNSKPSDIVMISNDDVKYDEYYIYKMSQRLEQNGLGYLISGIGIGNNSNRVVDLPLNWSFDKLKGTRISDYNENGNCVSTRSLIMFAEDMICIGGFHPILLPHYASDYEWTIRAAKKGFKIKTYKELTYIVNEDSTGYRDRKKASIKQVMSKKSNMNPIYRLNFILLITPLKCLPSALMIQFKRVLKG